MTTGEGTMTDLDAGAVPRGVTPPSGAGGRFLSDVIVQLGFADREAVDQALDASRAPGKKLGTTLVEMGAVTERELGRAVAERYRLDFLDLAEFDIDPEAVYVIGDAEMRRYDAVPVAFTEDGALVVAMIDPADWLAAEEMAQMTGRRIRRAVAAPSEVTELISRVAEARSADRDGGGADSAATTGLQPRLALRPVTRPMAGKALGREFGLERPGSEDSATPQESPPAEHASPQSAAPVPGISQPEKEEGQVIPLNPPAAETYPSPETVGEVGEERATASPDESPPEPAPEPATDAQPSEPSEELAADAPFDQTQGFAAITEPEEPQPTSGPWRAPTSEPAEVEVESVAEAAEEEGTDATSELEPAADAFAPAEPDSDLPVQADGGSDSDSHPNVDGHDEPPAVPGEPSGEADAGDHEVSEEEGPEQSSTEAWAMPSSDALSASAPAPASGPAAEQHEDSRAELTALRTQLNESNALQARTRDELEGARGDLATMRGRYDGAVERAAEAERLLAEARAQTGRLEAELSAAKEQAQTLRDDLSWARGQMEQRSEREDAALAELRGHIEAMQGLRPVGPPPPQHAEPSEPTEVAHDDAPTAEPADASPVDAVAPDQPANETAGAVESDATPLSGEPVEPATTEPEHTDSPAPGAKLDVLPATDPEPHRNGSAPAAAPEDNGTNKARGLKRLIAAVRRL